MREVYTNPPIVLMVIEIRHVPCAPLNTRQITQMTAAVRSELPIPDEISEVSVTIQSGPGGQPIQSQVVTKHPRWVSRNKRTALTIRQDCVLLETTEYERYERVRGLLALALRARMSVEKPAGVARIGLRYIDEIRVPSKDDEMEPDWGQWVDSSLLGPRAIKDAGLTELRNEGLTLFAGVDGKRLALRYGAQDDYAVQSTPQLRRPLPPPGPLFKFDVDSFWQQESEVPEFDYDFILRCADQLHEPVDAVFENLITDRLRNEVLRRA
ncbi:TIGR04255 family protein [Bifidobacterium aquikefiri]